MRRCVKRKRDSARSERGAAAVEFALIVPILCALVFGIINYGDILSARQAVSQAAAEGARAGAVSQKTTDALKEDDAKAATNKALATQGESCRTGAGGCTFKVDWCDSAKTGSSDPKCMFVSVVVDHEALVPGFTFGFGGALRYSASARVS